MKRRHALLLMTLVLLALAGCGENAVSSGDRVLVAKFLYDTHLEKPERYQVVVFKYPEQPIKEDRSRPESAGQVPNNYIKRLMGLPGELLAIFFGRIFRCRDDASQQLREKWALADRSANPLDLWRPEFMHVNDKSARDLFQSGKVEILRKPFEILRKPLATMLAMRRMVYDNDHQAKDLKGVFPPRWNMEKSTWTEDTETGFRNPGGAAPEVAWLRYQHVLRPQGKANEKPQLIRDFSGYNSYVTRSGDHEYQPNNWVGDLMLEFELTVDRPEGELWLELARGVDRFQARWNLQTGECRLTRNGKDVGNAATRLNHPGTYLLRFANFDDRLTIWVDRDLPFGDGVIYQAPAEPGPTDNDLHPALIGSKGAPVRVHHLKLWRDTYYTHGTSSATDAGSVPGSGDVEFWSDPKSWEPLRRLEPTTLYIQPGHYLCLGDNSAASSDSRTWGTVPERLMLGRALGVYWPVSRFGAIR